MTKTTWTGKSGDSSWFTAGNWTQGVPLADTSTVFEGGVTAYVSLAGTQHASAGSLSVEGSLFTISAGTLDLNAPPPKNGNAIDLKIGDGGQMAIASSATLTSQNDILVGIGADGSLSAGTLSVFGSLTSSVLRIVDGSMLVSGTAAHVTESVGLYVTVSDGSLTISDGATVDAGPTTLADNYAFLNVGSGVSGAGLVTVSGTHSVLTEAGINLGNGYDGTLSVLAGGLVQANYLEAGTYGDGFLIVSGRGSAFTAVRSIRIGSIDLLPVASRITIVDHGSVSVGTFGLYLGYGTLVMDATAHLTGDIVSQVGRIDAVARSAAHPGTVTLGQAITLYSNNGEQGQYDHNTTVYSEGGATLKLTGLITGQNDAVLSAGSGHVVLTDGSNSYASTALYNALLEIKATGAAGSGTLTFTGGASQAPVLQLDRGVMFANTVAGFAGHDTIDLRGFGFGSGVTDQFAAGTLTLDNGHATATLAFAGSYTADSFAFASDQHGGTSVTLKT